MHRRPSGRYPYQITVNLTEDQAEAVTRFADAHGVAPAMVIRACIEAVALPDEMRRALRRVLDPTS